MSVEQSVQLTIPVALTAARIERINPAIDEKTAEALARELHDIVKWVRISYDTRPLLGAYAADEAIDVIETVLRTAFDVWPSDPDGNARRSHVAANEAIWLAERFIATNADELYWRYLAVCSSIAGRDVSGGLLEERLVAPRAALGERKQ